MERPGIALVGGKFCRGTFPSWKPCRLVRGVVSVRAGDAAVGDGAAAAAVGFRLDGTIILETAWDISILLFDIRYSQTERAANCFASCKLVSVETGACLRRRTTHLFACEHWPCAVGRSPVAMTRKRTFAIGKLGEASPFQIRAFADWVWKVNGFIGEFDIRCVMVDLNVV